jgi:signal transduction histidine kinase
VASVDLRVLVHAPYGRDAKVIAEVLQRRQLRVEVCAHPDDLVRALGYASGATVLTEECLAGGLNAAIGQYLSSQPLWSDYPFVVLATPQGRPRSTQAVANLRELGNLVLLERPVNAETLASAVQSALRVRRRQYQSRMQLEELGAAKRQLEEFNQRLEQRVDARTRDLAAANDRLMQEIAERERAQISLVQGQKMEAIGQLTGGIAHDFNNLLHVVTLNLQLIERSTADERLRGFATRAKDAANRGMRVTAQLLSFARARSLVPRLHDVNALITDMAELIDVSVGSAVRVSRTVPAEPAWVMVDAAQLEMALLNMAVNARDAMPSGGTLDIGTRTCAGPGRAAAADAASPQGIEIRMRDSGVGIAPSLLQKVFDPFFTTKAVGSGTGLGLSQVYGFVRQSGGSVEIDSTVGEGTTLRLWFPLASAPQSSAAEEPDTPPVGTAEVLVVEDDASVRASIVECLYVLGYRVREAADGARGLHMLQQHRPDLLVADYLMPGLNGVDLIVEARKLYPGIPTLLATGFADMSRVEQVLGNQRVLSKPFDIDALARAVNGALQVA